MRDNECGPANVGVIARTVRDELRFAAILVQLGDIAVACHESSHWRPERRMRQPERVQSSLYRVPGLRLPRNLEVHDGELAKHNPFAVWAHANFHPVDLAYTLEFDALPLEP